MAAKNHQKRTYQIIKSFKAKSLKKRPIHIKVADALTTQFGTLGFLLVNIGAFTFWILANSGKIPGVSVFDPYPYVLLINIINMGQESCHFINRDKSLIEVLMGDHTRVLSVEVFVGL